MQLYSKSVVRSADYRLVMETVSVRETTASKAFASNWKYFN